MTQLAIVGSGIAGLGCAHFLHQDFAVTLFEQDDHTGGHANTVEAAEPGTGRRLPIDTGFMVFNRVTYPSLSRLFDSLGIPVKPAPMSFSVRHAASGLEFCGSSLNHLFCQRRNLLRPRFHRLLAAIHRFNRESPEALSDPALVDITLADYVARRGYGGDFLELYLLPMSSAVWSTPPELMLGFPAATLLRFFHNHGFLGLNTQHPWLTVDGGSRVYVRKLLGRWGDRVRMRRAATGITRCPGGGIAVGTADGSTLFDRVILACHADQALRLLVPALPREEALLGQFRYLPNTAVLHTDARVMPRTRLAWSSWNYEIAPRPGGGASTATHYWMNSLQGVSDRENYFVSLGRTDGLDPARILRTIPYEHPLFDLGAIRAQGKLDDLNASAVGASETYFAGSYFGYGFHEDAFLSAVRISRRLLGRDPWK